MHATTYWQMYQHKMVLQGKFAVKGADTYIDFEHRRLRDGNFTHDFTMQHSSPNTLSHPISMIFSPSLRAILRRPHHFGVDTPIFKGHTHFNIIIAFREKLTRRIRETVNQLGLALWPQTLLGLPRRDVGGRCCPSKATTIVDLHRVLES